MKIVINTGKIKVTPEEMAQIVAAIPAKPAEPPWKDRFVHVAKKLAAVLGLNNEERQWVREAGFNCPDEKEPE